MKTEKIAIIAIDPVNSFFKDGTLPVPQAEEIITPINRLVATATWNGIKTFVVREGHPERSRHFDKWPIHGVRGSWGAEVHPRLRLEGAKYFVKGTSHEDDGYSGFEGVAETDEKTKLADDLRAAGITAVALVGLATDYCVKATAISAREEGFKALLVTDAVRAVNLKPEDGEKAIVEMTAAGVELTTSQQLINAWK